MNQEAKSLIELAITEDIGNGDHSSLACIRQDQTSKAILWAKEKGVLAGAAVAAYVFERLDSTSKLKWHKRDGDTICEGDKIFEVEANAIKLLQAERLALNFMQRMSGIATNTARYSEAIAHTKAKVLDTRKTTPGLRYFEKWAVRIGGGFNHRMGLYDMVMLKDNHIDFAGGISKAVSQVVNYLSENKLQIPIEVEARNLLEVEEILATHQVQRIMLDNFNISDTQNAVALIAGATEIESSGGITLSTIAQYAECGVDFISIGALTHHIKSLDMSLKAE